MSQEDEEEWEGAGPRGAFPRNALSLGYLACLPLLAFYELGLAAAPGEGRNAAELLLGRALRPLGGLEAPVRWSLLGVVALLAWGRVRSLGAERVARFGLTTLLEGLAVAMVLGPLLLGGLRLLDVHPLPEPRPLDASAELVVPPSPDAFGAARLVGGAVWEEGLFRVGVYGLAFLVAVRLARFFGAPRAVGLPLGELAGLGVSALAFAAFHLDVLTRRLGAGGEPYDPALFAWRVGAGLLLAVVVRWRGLGVAAWAHGLFNLALLLGAAPA